MPNKSVYYRQPYLEILINEVKQPFKEAVDVLTNGKSNPLQKVKAGKKLLKVMDVIVNKLPEPTVENTRKPGTHALIGISERFFSRLHFPEVERYLRPMVKGVIVIYDTDLYAQWINWWVWEIKAVDWPELRPMEPDPHYFDEE